MGSGEKEKENFDSSPTMLEGTVPLILALGDACSADDAHVGLGLNSFGSSARLYLFIVVGSSYHDCTIIRNG